MEKQKCPEVRFKGFGGDWVQSNLAECTDLLTGNPFNSKEFTSSGIFLVRGMNVKRGYLDTSTNLSKYWPSSKGLEHYLLEPEDIVIQMDGALIGKSYAKVNSKNLPALLVQRVARVRSNDVEIEFIYQYIHRDFLRHISGIKTETAVPHLSLNDIRDFTIFLPRKQEQTGIGNFFQNLDESIALQQKKFTQTHNLKKAMLEKMFPKAGSTQPEIRLKGFSGDWEQKYIGEFTKVASGARVHKEEWTSSGVPFFRSSDVVSSYKGNGNTKAYISFKLFEKLIQASGKLEKDDLLITGGGSIGIPYLNPNNEPLYSKDADLIWIKKSSEHNSQYLYTFFSTSYFRNFIASISHIGTIAHYTIEQVKATPVCLPAINEQIQIGIFFKQLDETLSLQKQQLQTLKNLKQAFLEKMFV